MALVSSELMGNWVLEHSGQNQRMQGFLHLQGAIHN